MSQEKNTAYNVQCPQCSATLEVSDIRKTYICPVCAKLVNIRLMRKYEKTIEDEEVLAVACTNEKLDEHLETAAEVAALTPPVQEALQEEKNSRSYVGKGTA